MTNAQEKARWLRKANPYKQPYMWDAFREGARAWWARQGAPVGWVNPRERAAFWRGYKAAEEAFPRDPGYYIPDRQTDPA